MLKTFSFLLVTGGIALLACSSPATSSSSGTCAGYVTALQENASRCGKSSNAPQQSAESVARLNTLCSNALNAPGNGIAPSSVDACAQELRTSCEDGPQCEGLGSTAGTLPDGSACGADSQCAGGDCRTDGGQRNPCGKCVTRAPIGAPCGTTTGAPSCVRGAVCISKAVDGPGTCVANPRLAEGEVCYDPTKPSSSGAGNCATGLTCQVGSGSGTTPVKCTKKGAAGATCGSENDCLTELGCIKGTCATRLPDGADCEDSGDCATGACPRPAKKCVAIQYGAAGAVCNSDDKRCARGSCSRTGDTAEGTCVDPIPDGGACTEKSSSSGPRCDQYADCINGTCQILDPATCK